MMAGFSADKSFAAGNKLKTSAKYVKGNAQTVAVSWKYSGDKKISYYRVSLYDGTKWLTKKAYVPYFTRYSYKDYGRPEKNIKVSKKKSSYTFKKLKANKVYVIVVDGFSKKGTHEVSGRVEVTTGAPRVIRDYEKTARVWNKITPCFGIYPTNLSYKADSFQIYRRAEGSPWKKVKTVKAKKNILYTYKYVDKKVDFGKVYQYKIRSISKVKINGKKKTVKGPFSTVFKLRAADDPGLLTASIDPATPAAKDMKTVEITVTSQEKNGDTVLRFQKDGTIVWLNDYGYCADPSGWFVLTDYKLPGGDWQEAKGEVSLTAGGSISFRFAAKGENDKLDLTDENASIYFDGAVYDGDYRTICIRPVKGVGSIFESAE